MGGVGDPKRLKDGKELSRNFNQGYRVYDSKGIANTLSSQPLGGKAGLTGLYKVKAVLTPDRINKRQHGRRFKEDGEPSFTLTGQDIHGVQINEQIRRLTPVECERLQGFPDGWTKYGINEKGETVEISDTQRYKVLGNAVTVPVISEIVKRLFGNVI